MAIFDRYAGTRELTRACFAILFAAILLTACGGNTRPTPPPTYTVKRGDTLYSIAWRHDLDYRTLARWNKLPADFSIYPGQVLRLHPPKGQSGAAARQPSRPPAKSPAKPSVPKLQDIPAKDRVASWVWPVDASARAVQKTNAPGLLIGGTEGQTVRAAAAGKVVYTGSGVRGFGELVIVKHTEVFLSAYAHNRAIAVKEGDEVKGGQTIAEMGLGPRQQPVLYFEIRINGQPVDPSQFLPLSMPRQ